MFRYENIKDEEKVINTCKENGYDINLINDWFCKNSNKGSNALDLRDKNRRIVTVSSIDDGEIGIHLFNYLTIEEAESILKELKEAINLAKYLKENIE